MVNILGTVIAGSANCFFMRKKELNGVNVMIKNDNNE